MHSFMSFKTENLKIMKRIKTYLRISYLLLLLIIIISCKKDKKTSPEQYYGEPIEATREYFSMQELFDFTSSPAVSPDGRYLAYVIAATISAEKQGIWIADLQTGEKYMLKKHASFPSWGPNSQQLCYTLNGNLYINNPIGNTVEQITQGTRCLRPDWHPSKNKIVYDGSILGIYTIDAVDISSKSIIHQISAIGVGVNAGGWIGNSDLIMTKIDNTYKILNILTGEILSEIKAGQITNTQTVSNPAVSRDGTKIAFQADNAIYTINTDGTSLQQLLYNRVNKRPGEPYKKGNKLVNNLCWHPDGKHIIYQQIEFTDSKIASWGFLMGEGYSTMLKLNIEKALQINKP